MVSSVLGLNKKNSTLLRHLAQLINCSAWPVAIQLASFTVSDTVGMYYSERRAGQGMKRAAILVPWCPLCLGVLLMREAWCSDHGEGSLGSIKIHCEVSGEGHSPAVGTPKARRVNKDPPMKLHGKGLDITAITYCHY